MKTQTTSSYNTQTLTKIALCVTLLCVSSYIYIPLPFSPTGITAQTLIINMIALILTPKQSFAAVTAYILLGVCGLPVFSGGHAGLGRLVGPTGGFLLAFLICAPLMSYLKGKSRKQRYFLFITILVGMPIIYILGALQMYITTPMNLPAVLLAAVIPYIPGDIFKCIAGSYLAMILLKAFERAGLSS